MSETTREDSIRTIAGIIKDVRFALLTTVTAEGHLHARPMTTQEQEFDGDIWFLGNRDGEAVDDIRARSQVNVSYAQPDKGEYVSINGTAELVEDRAKLEELWSDAYKAYYPEGIDDPKIQLIKVSAHGAEFWESHGKVRSLFGFAKGLLTGTEADMGKNDSVKL